MCLEDAPSADAIQTDPTALVGLSYDADAQCQALFGPDAFFCTGFIDVSYLNMSSPFHYWMLHAKMGICTYVCTYVHNSCNILFKYIILAGQVAKCII